LADEKHLHCVAQKGATFIVITILAYTVQRNKNTCITHGGRLLSQIWGAGSRRASRGGYMLRVV